jgi:hypothetical protein
MSFYTQVIDRMSAALQVLTPNRIVSRNLMDYDDNTPIELERGIYIMLSAGTRPNDFSSEYLSVILVGRIRTNDLSPAAAIEEAEFSMIDEIRTYVQRIMGVNVINESGCRQSGQIDSPEGFVSCTLRVGPFCLIEPQLPQTIIDNIKPRDLEPPADPVPQVVNVGFASAIGDAGRSSSDYTTL